MSAPQARLRAPAPHAAAHADVPLAGADLSPGDGYGLLGERPARAEGIRAGAVPDSTGPD